MTNQKIFVIGATGQLGIIFCREALKRGHPIVIYARNPSKLPEDVAGHTHTKIIQGQLNNSEALIGAVSGCNLIFSALGPPARLSAVTLEEGTYTSAYRAIMFAMRRYGIKRIFVLGTPAIRTPRDKEPFQVRVFVTFLKMTLHYVWKEMVAIGKMFDEEAKDLQWTIYRIGMLRSETGVTLASKYVGEKGWCFTTYRVDVAKWILNEIERDIPWFVHQMPALSSRKTDLHHGRSVVYA